MSERAFVAGRSKEAARRLLGVARELGLPSDGVEATDGGYFVPVEVADAIFGPLVDDAVKDLGGDAPVEEPKEKPKPKPKRRKAKAEVEVEPEAEPKEEPQPEEAEANDDKEGGE